MAANLIWRPQAREDLLLIYEFIGLDNRPLRNGYSRLLQARRPCWSITHAWGRAVPISSPLRASCSKGRISFFTRRTPIRMKVQSTKSKSFVSSTAAAT